MTWNLFFKGHYIELYGADRFVFNICFVFCRLSSFLLDGAASFSHVVVGEINTCCSDLKVIFPLPWSKALISLKYWELLSHQFSFTLPCQTSVLFSFLPQGGAISILTACERPTDFAGVVLIAPMVQMNPDSATPFKVLHCCPLILIALSSLLSDFQMSTI